MTESEYLASTDPTFLLTHVTDRTSERKLRLFICACCREIWPLLVDPRSRAVVATVERFVDGGATDAEVVAARDAAWAATGVTVWAAARAAAWAAAWAAAENVVGAAPAVMWEAARYAVLDATRAAGAAVRAPQAALLRCVLGNPWQPAPLPWPGRHGLVRPLAQRIYDTRDWGALPVLADALEEADCDATDVLAHLRGSGPHCRGCWCVDLVLGLS